MRCKQGDLAIIIRSSAGNEGKIVRCLQYWGTFPQTYPNGSVQEGHIWKTDTLLRTWKGEPTHFVADDQLKPIDNPPDDATDETILRVGKPTAREKEHA